MKAKERIEIKETKEELADSVIDAIEKKVDKLELRRSEIEKVSF